MQRAASNSDVETRNSFEILLSSCTTLSAAVHVPVDSNGDLSKTNAASGRTELEVKKFALHAAIRLLGLLSVYQIWPAQLPRVLCGPTQVLRLFSL